jgi:hypothetical protein
LEQGVGGNEEAGGADAALEGGVFEERLLEGVEGITVGEAFDGGDGLAGGLDAEDEAGGDDAVAEFDGAGAAVAIAAAFFGTGEADDVAETFKERLAGFAEELDGLVIDGGLDLDFGGHTIGSPGRG